jgi:hypothetical protein
MLSRTTAGLLYRSAGADTDWTMDSGWTIEHEPTFVACGPLPITHLGPDDFRGDREGTREPQILIDGAAWHFFYDSGDGVHGWLVRHAVSTDRGLTWTRLGPLGPGYAKLGGGEWLCGVVWGWMCRWGDTYYQYRMPTDTPFQAPNVGLTGSPYYYEIATAANLDGPWTLVRQMGLVPGTWAELDHLPGSVVRDGSTYHSYEQGRVGFQSTIGRSSGSSPDGPFTLDLTRICDNTTFGLSGRSPENPKVFYSATLGRWVLLANLIHPSGLWTDSNVIGCSVSPTDWSGAIFRRIQPVSPLHGSPSIGVVSHLTGPDGQVIEGPGGEVPIVWDTDPTRHAEAGNHLGRRIRAGCLEPATHALWCAGISDTTYRQATRTLAHSDFVLELALEILGEYAYNQTEFYILYRFDAGISNGYRAVLLNNGISLQKLVAGTGSTLSGPVAGQSYQTNMFHTVKLAIAGNRHRAWLDGTLQYDYTDAVSPIASGVRIGLLARGATLDVRLLSVRTSDVLTIQGMTPGRSCWIRGFGGLPAGSATADGSGTATFSHVHWPLWSIDLEGVDYTVSGGLWGGDTLTFSGLPAIDIAVAVRSLAVR